MWDLTWSDPEVPFAIARDVSGKSRPLNKVCWETGTEGRRVVTEVLDGRVQVWDLGSECGGARGGRKGGKEEV